ncbi:MAG: response regulator [Alphaproteobacteria bacterium]|nr:response regulator [Alphaproteobacteria bacterium]
MAYDLSGVSVLVIEDDSRMKQLLREILEGFSVRAVRTAAEGRQALERVREFDPDIVVVDLRMEPIDGLDFTRMVRRGEGGVNPFLPIIMLTGHTERHRVAEARDAGVTEFLAKPVSAQALYSRIAAIVERPRPFVRAPSFIGPDRRRRKDPGYGGRERRGGAAAGLLSEANTVEI